MALTPSEILDLFDEKVEKFLALHASKAALSRMSASLRLNAEASEPGSHIGPNGEPFEALVLTLRFFIQDSEPTSLRQMRNLYGRLPVSRETIEQLEEQCEQLNRFLDSATPLAVEEHRPLTYRDILNLFIYGDYAHANAERRRMFKALRSTPFLPMFQFHLGECIRAFTVTLHFLRAINAQARQQLSVG